eukprot:3618084-Karenia_brevis.AAC.2
MAMSLALQDAQRPSEPRGAKMKPRWLQCRYEGHDEIRCGHCGALPGHLGLILVYIGSDGLR